MILIGQWHFSVPLWIDAGQSFSTSFCAAGRGATFLRAATPRKKKTGDVSDFARREARNQPTYFFFVALRGAFSNIITFY
jgi:hypothetical protein